MGVSYFSYFLVAFATPVSLDLVELDAEGMLDTAVEDMGKIFIGCELGGGGTTTTDTVAIADTGVRNLLAHFGIIEHFLRAARAFSSSNARDLKRPSH